MTNLYFKILFMCTLFYLRNLGQGLCLKVSLKYNVLAMKVSSESLDFSLYISENYIPLSRPYYIHHTKYIYKRWISQ